MTSLTQRCDNTSEHEWHEIVVNRTRTCSGKTVCGVHDHEPHDVVVEVQAWCAGICLCSTSRGVHGPGAHK